METRQYTIKKKVSFAGVGLHSGKRVKLSVKPAPIDSGIRFVRSDLDRKVTIPAYMNRVVNTFLATTISEDNVRISTTEHLMAALHGLGIDNAIIELNNNEVPIMDGSAAPFVRMLHKVDRKEQKAARKVLKITREISWQQNGSEIRILPYDGLKITCGIDFDHPLINNQSYTINISPDSFIKEIASARTFGFLEEVEKLRQSGLALGGSLDNAIVVDESGILNNEGLRFPDEFVRHKILDLLGDLALLGCPLQGHVIASKAGHTQHLALLKTIADHPECWEFVTFRKNRDKGVFERVASTTKAAGNKILPYLVPPGIELPEVAACSA
jgi:UDP-3-O-[3-hydroxymyristoyl] N-acetylglucosamine deacetylase